jgi:PAS domain-containing protein/DNA-binding CsgD family transcriptional regulator
MNELAELKQAIALIDTIGVATLGLLPSGRIVYANAAATELLGYPQQMLLERNIGDLAPAMTPDAWARVWDEVERRSGFEEQRELKFRLPSQEEEPVLKYSALRIQSRGQKACALFLVDPKKPPVAVIDVASQRSELLIVLEAFDNPVAVIDSTLCITAMNQAASRLFGFPAFDCTGKPFIDSLPKEQADAVAEKMRAALLSGHHERYQGGHFFTAAFGPSISFLPFFDSSTSQKKLLAVFGVSKSPLLDDATKHQPGPGPAPAPFEPRLAEMSRFMEDGAVGIFLKNRENRYIWLNKRFAKMVGFEAEELLGKRVEELINDPQLMAALREEDETVYRTGRPLMNLVKQPQPPEGIFVRLDKIPLIGKSGTITGILGLALKIDPPEPAADRLGEVTRRLAETETALRVVLEHQKTTAPATQTDAGERIKRLVLPYLESLKQSPMTPDQQEFVQLIDDNLKRFYEPMAANLSNVEYKLSPTEVKVARLVRDGKTNKEIANLLNLSVSTILTHRHHLRKKLGIRNKKVNLRTLLQS